MQEPFSDAYRRAFDAALHAAADELRVLPEDELRELTRYTGIVGLAAEHVLLAQKRGPRAVT